MLVSALLFLCNIIEVTAKRPTSTWQILQTQHEIMEETGNAPKENVISKRDFAHLIIS